jgi:hypothetical protein
LPDNDVIAWLAKHTVNVMNSTVITSLKLAHSTVTDFAKFLGLSTSVPRAQAV